MKSSADFAHLELPHACPTAIIPTRYWRPALLFDAELSVGRSVRTRAADGSNGAGFIPGWRAAWFARHQEYPESAIRHRFPRTSGNGFREQPFELREILDLGANVVEVMFCDLTHLGA
jgi:hypothetical protein